MFRWVLLMMFTISTAVQIHLLMYYIIYFVPYETHASKHENRIP
jgi:hypothetical protein